MSSPRLRSILSFASENLFSRKAQKIQFMGFFKSKENVFEAIFDSMFEWVWTYIQVTSSCKVVKIQDCRPVIVGVNNATEFQMINLQLLETATGEIIKQMHIFLKKLSQSSLNRAFFALIGLLSVQLIVSDSRSLQANIKIIPRLKGKYSNPKTKLIVVQLLWLYCSLW